MKEKKHYISLSFKGGNVYHQNGKQLKLAERIVTIGETADCDVRYETDGLQPEYYASIIQNEDEKSWRIVKRSPYVDIQIVGKGTIGFAHTLNDGDIIQISSQPMSLTFHEHYDDRFDVDEQQRLWPWAIAGLLSLIALVALGFSIGNEQDSISTKDVEPLEGSVCLLKVDSVRQILITNDKEELLYPTKILGSKAPTGTAFLTTDGQLITARHCVEYWIGANLELTTKVAELKEDDIVRWAIETETFNQIHEIDSVMQLRVFFSIYDFMGNKKYSFESTDRQVHINTDKDGVFLLADFNKEYYWRSVRPYFTDRQMALGDILWIDNIPEKGKIHLAGAKELEHVKNGTKLMICGYPTTGIGDKRMSFTEGTIRFRTSATNENLFFESNINHGFSGGPVLMKSGSTIVAVGVVSRVDSISSGLFKWAVPVSEVKSENCTMNNEQ